MNSRASPTIHLPSPSPEPRCWWVRLKYLQRQKSRTTLPATPMKEFVAMIFEFNTGEKNPSATLWIKATTDISLKGRVPLEMETDFTPLGPLPCEMAESISSALKDLLNRFGVEWIEHSTADD